MKRRPNTEPRLFADNVSEESLAAMVNTAAQAPCFNGVSHGIIDRLLRAARRAERVTRHKFNPVCPSLGDRATLVDAGILTDTLPSL